MVLEEMTVRFYLMDGICDRRNITTEASLPPHLWISNPTMVRVIKRDSAVATIHSTEITGHTNVEIITVLGLTVDHTSPA